MKKKIVIAVKVIDEKKVCNNTECEHEFTNDWIDIDPDRSIMIWYCTKCYITQ